MAGIISRSTRRLCSQLQQLRGMASFTSARPGEPTPPISDAHRGPTGVLEVGASLVGAGLQLLTALFVSASSHLSWACLFPPTEGAALRTYGCPDI